MSDLGHDPLPTPAVTLGGGARLDPDLAPPGAGGAPDTMLDLLAEELGESPDVDTVDLEVPARPGYAVRVRPSIEYDELSAWRKRAKDNTRVSGVNELKLAAIIIANRTEGILRQGELVVSDGEPLTFASPALHRLVGAGRAVEAVIRLYGKDGHVLRAAGDLLLRAGYDDDISEADPTTR